MDERYVFDVEWYNQQASLIIKMKLSFYPSDNSVELFNLKTHKLFLKRTKMPNIKKEEFIIGGTVSILSRQFLIKDYSDENTRKVFAVDNQKTFAMIKPDGVKHFGEIVQRIESEGIQISKLKMRRLSEEQTRLFYKEHQGKSFYENLYKFIASGLVVGLQLVGKDVISKWRMIIGPTNCQLART